MWESLRTEARIPKKHGSDITHFRFSSSDNNNLYNFHSLPGALLGISDLFKLYNDILRNWFLLVTYGKMSTQICCWWHLVKYVFELEND
jgi:hypothetical protein